MSRRALTWCSLFAQSTLAFGCALEVDERAQRDLEVGRAEASGVELLVDDGLAQVRELRPEFARLWVSAPSFALGLHLSTARDFTMVLDNVLPGAVLEVRDAAGTQLAFRSSATERVTRRRLQFSAPDGDIRLHALAPPVAEPVVRFGLLSDIQGGMPRIGEVFERINREVDLDFVLSTGDLGSRGSKEELERFEEHLAALHIPFYSGIGNHELFESPPPFQDLFGRATSHFHFRGVAFSNIDSASATLAPRVMDWLEDWLEQDRHRTHIVLMHIPPVDPVGVRNGSFGSRSEAHHVLARLAEGRVDLTLYGHIHSYYAFENAGISAYISGGGGAVPERFDRVGRHFLVITADPDRVRSVRLVRVDGRS